MSTIKDTLFGIIHALVAQTYIPETVHQNTMAMVRRMVIFVYKALVERDLDEDGKSFPCASKSHSVHMPHSDPDRHHVPRLKDYNLLMDLLTLAFLGIMSNALDFKTYRYPGKDADDPLSPEELSLMSAYDLNSMDGTERTLCMYVRGLSWELVTWVAMHYQLETGRQSLNFDCFYTSYFAHIASAILRSKSQAGVQPEKGAPGCTYERLKYQIDVVFTPRFFCGGQIESLLEDPTDTLQRDLTVIQYLPLLAPVFQMSPPALIRKGRSKAEELYEK